MVNSTETRTLNGQLHAAYSDARHWFGQVFKPEDRDEALVLVDRAKVLWKCAGPNGADMKVDLVCAKACAARLRFLAEDW